MRILVSMTVQSIVHADLRVFVSPEHRNWVEEWWLQKGYMELRLPLLYMNFVGVPDFLEFFPPQEGTEVLEENISMFHALKLVI